MLILFVFSDEAELSKFEYIYHKYKRLLLRKANDILYDFLLAEDAVSEAFIRVYKNLHKIKDPDSAETASFLYIIVKHTAIDILNKNKNIYPSDFQEEDYQSGFDLEESVLSEIVTGDMLRVVDGLKEEYKSCFLLMYAYDMSYKEIGRLLNISESNVAVRIHRAKKILAGQLGKEKLL